MNNQILNFTVKFVLHIVIEIICEGKITNPSCASRNMSLYIIDVFYGRIDTSICPHSEIHSNSCVTTTAPFERVHELCTGRTTCSIEVYSNTMGGDSCPGSYKYMQLGYECQGKINTSLRNKHVFPFLSEGLTWNHILF